MKRSGLTSRSLRGEWLSSMHCGSGGVKVGTRFRRRVRVGARGRGDRPASFCQNMQVLHLFTSGTLHVSNGSGCRMLAHCSFRVIVMMRLTDNEMSRSAVACASPKIERQSKEAWTVEHEKRCLFTQMQTHQPILLQPNLYFWCWASAAF